MVRLSKVSTMDTIISSCFPLVIMLILLHSMSYVNPMLGVFARRKPPQGPPKFTFYIHVQIYNSNANNSIYTAVYDAGPFNFTQPNPYNFGVRATFESPITIGAANDSLQIGVARGTWILNSQTAFVLLHLFTATISSGPFTGSLVVFGQEDETLENRILAVVGGTGDFLAARGIAVSKLVTIDYMLPAHWTLSFDLDLYY